MEEKENKYRLQSPSNPTLQVEHYMKKESVSLSSLPPEQEAIRAKCFHPTGTFVEFSKEDVEKSIPERFEKVVRMYPDRLAIKMGDRASTYDELNKAANRIGHAILGKRGPGSEPIALLFEHGIDMIPAMLGVLKAGKFYLGLDPSFPQERNIRMLEDSGAGILVSNYRNLALANDKIQNSMCLLNIDELDQSTPSENPNLAIGAEELACLLYTSGSTGKPKGIVCPHRNLVFNGVVHGHVNNISADDKLTLFHSIAFGSSHINLYQSLLNGASIHPFDIRSAGIIRIASWLYEERITVFHSAPLVFRQFAESLSDQIDISTLRLINLSGAPVSKLEIDLYRAHFPATTVFEISIGSTETHTFASFIVDQDFRLPDSGVPVGYPRPGREVLILDEAGNVVEPGQTGQIAVRSRYLNLPFPRESWTNRDSQSASDSIYLTGDLGRIIHDGFLIHVGRKDFMVKIRGYRVELGEIERALLLHPQVKEAGVAAWEREPGEKYLVGYVVPRQESVLNVSELNDFLRNKLPDYMIPSTFVFLNSLPLTNGKLDRSALPKPDNRRPRLKTPYGPPRSDGEKILSQIWSEVLALDQVGIHDNFFDLGGHSLAATRIVSQVLKKFQFEMPIKALFDSPTVAEMAVIITENQAKRVSDAELARMLREVEAMTEEEAQKQLAGERAGS